MIEQSINIDRMEHVVALFGSFDRNIEIIRQHLDVKIILRGSELKVQGDAENVIRATKTLWGLIGLIEKGETITEQNVNYMLSLVETGAEEAIQKMASDVVAITVQGKPIKAKTLGQQAYVDAINKNTITLGIGPAGTGKTYLAVAMAAKAFRSHDITRIILTRPAVEAGEKLGFLPGDLQTKVDPYLRPLYDALFEMFGMDNYQKHLERGNIEIAPLAYMRGRTLEDSFIILDEAQNTTQEQMKMFLTRLGHNSKMVITGDITQIDLPIPSSSGLIQGAKVLEEVKDVGIVYFTEEDVVRHKLVQRIIIAYDKYNQDRRGVNNDK